MRNISTKISFIKHKSDSIKTGLTQKEPKVGVIHELPLRKNKVFSHILRKSYKNLSLVAYKHNQPFDGRS